MNNSFKTNENQLKEIIEYYKEFQLENINNDNILFKAKTGNFTVTIFSNFTVFFQGKNVQEELNKWTDNQIQLELDLNEIEEDNQIIDHIGSDEVGCGDYFGPVVVCCTYVKKENYEFLKSIGVKDSKQLSDATIIQLAKKIIDTIPVAYFVLSNKKYNEMVEKGFNLNKIKSYLHNYVLYNLVKKYNFNGKIVIDQFCSEELYYSYLSELKNDIQKGIHFTTKAENKYIAVACASIVARYIFLEKINEIEKIINEKIILGASEKVDLLAKKIYEEKGLEYLSNYVKIHFKNTNKIKETNSI